MKRKGQVTSHIMRSSVPDCQRQLQLSGVTSRRVALRGCIAVGVPSPENLHNVRLSSVTKKRFVTLNMEHVNTYGTLGNSKSHFHKFAMIYTEVNIYTRDVLNCSCEYLLNIVTIFKKFGLQDKAFPFFGASVNYGSVHFLTFP